MVDVWLKMHMKLKRMCSNYVGARFFSFVGHSCFLSELYSNLFEIWQLNVFIFLFIPVERAGCLGHVQIIFLKTFCYLFNIGQSKCFIASCSWPKLLSAKSL